MFAFVGRNCFVRRSIRTMLILLAAACLLVVPAAIAQPGDASPVASLATLAGWLGSSLPPGTALVYGILFATMAVLVVLGLVLLLRSHHYKLKGNSLTIPRAEKKKPEKGPVERFDDASGENASEEKPAGASEKMPEERSEEKLGEKLEGGSVNKVGEKRECTPWEKTEPLPSLPAMEKPDPNSMPAPGEGIGLESESAPASQLEDTASVLKKAKHAASVALADGPLDVGNAERILASLRYRRSQDQQAVWEYDRAFAEFCRFRESLSA
jgi:hypothetical protein